MVLGGPLVPLMEWSAPAWGLYPSIVAMDLLLDPSARSEHVDVLLCPRLRRYDGCLVDSVYLLAAHSTLFMQELSPTP